MSRSSGYCSPSLYLTALFVLGLTTLRKGHTVLFWFGILFPFLWIAGALMRPRPKRPPRAGSSNPANAFGPQSCVPRLSPVVWVPGRGLDMGVAHPGLHLHERCLVHGGRSALASRCSPTGETKHRVILKGGVRSRSPSRARAVATSSIVGTTRTPWSNQCSATSMTACPRRHRVPRARPAWPPGSWRDR